MTIRFTPVRSASGSAAKRSRKPAVVPTGTRSQIAGPAGGVRPRSTCGLYSSTVSSGTSRAFATAASGVAGGTVTESHVNGETSAMWTS